METHCHAVIGMPIVICELRSGETNDSRLGPSECKAILCGSGMCFMLLLCSLPACLLLLLSEEVCHSVAI